jgi:glucan biosynthesis protein C
LPIYILHLPVAVIIAFYVVAWPTLTAIKILVILGGTLAITLALCEVCVKRTRVTRFLFGMRSRR